MKTDLTKFKRFDGQPVVSRLSLRPAQASLYDMIVQKLQNGMPITLEEAESIWREKIAYKRTYNGVPHRTTYVLAKDGSNNWYAEEVPMTADEITFNVINWLTKNIGLLVMRGYLKVIPMVQLEPIKQEDKL